MNHSSSTLKLIIISCVVAAVAGAISCCAMTINKWELLCPPLLLGYLSCWLIAMGSACVLALGNLTGGHWAAATRAFYLAALNTFPFLVLLFVVIAFNLSQIYPWAFSYGGIRESLPKS